MDEMGLIERMEKTVKMGNQEKTEDHEKIDEMARMARIDETERTAKIENPHIKSRSAMDSFEQRRNGLPVLRVVESIKTISILTRHRKGFRTLPEFFHGTQRKKRWT